MDRMTLKEKMFNGDVVLDFNHGDNVLDLAKEKLWEYENTGLSPSEVAALKAENAELKEDNDCLKHNYEAIKEMHDRGYNAALKMINEKDSEISVLKQALEQLSCDIQFANCTTGIDKLKNYSCADERVTIYIKQAQSEIDKGE